MHMFRPSLLIESTDSMIVTDSNLNCTLQKMEGCFDNINVTSVLLKLVVSCWEPFTFKSGKLIKILKHVMYTG